MRHIPESYANIPTELISGDFLKNLLMEYCDDLDYWSREGRQASGNFSVRFDSDEGWMADVMINDAVETPLQTQSNSSRLEISADTEAEAEMAEEGEYDELE
jgi:hypothetical protein